MTKIKILYHNQLPTVWDSLGNTIFEFIKLRSGVTYDPNIYFVLVDYAETFIRVQHNPFDTNFDNWIQPYIDGNFKIIVDHTWESYAVDKSTITNNMLVLKSPHWMLIHEHFLYSQWGYKNQLLTSNIDKFFLLLMNATRAHRDNLYKKVTPYLNNSIYSYVSRGIEINGNTLNNNGFLQNDRAFDPTWYSTTAFSLVAETTLDLVRPPEYCPPIGQRLFVTEKSYKPFAFKHPFIIYGGTGTLSYLKSNGFETFDHIIDEGYDTIIDDQQRLLAIDYELNKLYTEYTQGKQLFGDSISREKIEHNFNRFYDIKFINQLINEEIITPIMDFVNA
jgi:hypothetical protein